MVEASFAVLCGVLLGSVRCGWLNSDSAAMSMRSLVLDSRAQHCLKREQPPTKLSWAGGRESVNTLSRSRVLNQGSTKSGTGRAGTAASRSSCWPTPFLPGSVRRARCRGEIGAGGAALAGGDFAAPAALRRGALRVVPLASSPSAPCSMLSLPPS
jgi:hypothetical protein